MIAQEEAKFDLDKFGKDLRHAKREKKVKILVYIEEIAKNTCS